MGNINQIKRRLSEAKKQLREGMPRKNRGRISYGCIAADVTKVAFSHNGLTFGMTNDHSRDVVQEKLITIANAVQRLPLFRDYRNLIQYWLQIHIPALITYPPATVTRFSSYMIHNERLDRKARRAVKILHQVYDGASKGDGREAPPQKLIRRRDLKVPKGSIFYLDEKLLIEYLDTGKITEHEPHEIIGELTMNDKKYEFSYFDFKTLITNISDDERRNLADDIVEVSLELLLEMYLQRYPYNELDV